LHEGSIQALDAIALDPIEVARTLNTEEGCRAGLRRTTR
jgi:hypothetical protein